MKMSLTIAAILISILTSLQLHATTNPQIRECNHSQGRFSSVSIFAGDENREDQIGLCIFNSAVLGSLDVLQLNSLQQPTLSIQHYTMGIKECLGEKISASTLEGSVVSLCYFESDKSVISIETLKNGVGHPSNLKLDQYLGLSTGH